MPISLWSFLLGTLAAAFLSGCRTAPADSPVGRILGYGIFQRAETEVIVKTPEAPSGVTRFPVGYLILATNTNRIPARKGIQFGMRYEITNLKLKDGDVVEVTKITLHPPMRKPDGNWSRTFSFVEKLTVQNGRAEAETGYGFDHDYELVEGTWQMTMKLGGKPLLTKKFIVSREN